MTLLEITKSANLTEICKKGEDLYQKVREKFEPTHNGEYLVIDPVTKKIYRGKTSVDAMMKGRKRLPETVFYLKKIGQDFSIHTQGIQL